MLITLVLVRLRRLKASFSYIASLRSAWATGDAVSNKHAKIKAKETKTRGKA